MSLYLQFSLKITPQMTGLILAVQPIMQAVFSPIAGILSDRVEPAILVSTGMGITAVSLFMFVFLNTHISIVFIVLVLFFLGFGYALFSSPNTNAVMSSVENRYYGIASGTLATMRAIGMVLSMAVATITFAVLIGQSAITIDTLPEFAKSVKISFIIFSVLCAAGVYFSAVRGNLERERLKK
jgi:MFS family permease